MFYENMDGDSAMICSALILGDKFGIDDNLYDGIKASGLAHVLAVSGLHVTALASAILALLKKTGLKPGFLPGTNPVTALVLGTLGAPGFGLMLLTPVLL